MKYLLVFILRLLPPKRLKIDLPRGHLYASVSLLKSLFSSCTVCSSNSAIAWSHHHGGCRASMWCCHLTLSCRHTPGWCPLFVLHTTVMTFLPPVRVVCCTCDPDPAMHTSALNGSKPFTHLLHSLNTPLHCCQHVPGPECC